MLSKIFKKDEPAAEPKLAATKSPQKSAPKAIAPEIAMEWRSKFQRAVGDDAALLALATETPLLDIKQAAVQAMQSEETLRAAEKEFRTHDRRVHRLAKQRFEHAVAQRETRAQAEALIAQTVAALGEENFPANRLVEIDHAWQSLDTSLLTAEQTATFQSRWAELIALMRGRGDQQLAISRWVHNATLRMTESAKTITAVKSGSLPQTALGEAAAQLQAVLVAAPSVDPGATDTQIVATLAEVQASLARLVDLDAAMTREGAQREEKAKEQAARESAKAEHKATHAANVEALTAEIVAAESTLAAGQLAETNKHLVAIDAMVEKDKSVPSGLSKRIDAVQAEYARLKGWQHWGGGRARDDLVLEAEALAARAADAKLNTKQHSDAIEHLRERWKELDKLGGATSRALWLRFDTALKAAYVPVAAQLAKLKAARDENLAARKALLDTLDKVAVASTASDGSAPTPANVDWKELARVIEQFNADWRKLGPVEHTVPHKAREGLLKRMEASVARVEAPLAEARRVAQLQREKLIAKAAALQADSQQRDTINKVRDLQAEWQAHAKQLPLARGVENEMWGRFKAATDAVFKQRDAANAARESAWSEQRAAREALIERLRNLADDAPAAEVKKTLQEVDTAWRKAGEVARKDAPQLDARYRTARDHAQKLLNSSATRAWGRVVNVLVTKLSLCDEIEAGNAENIESRWNEAGSLPSQWEQALQARRVGKAGLAAPKYDTALLRAESGLNLESPAAFQASRRELKLLAMKAAMENRGSGATTDIAALVAELIAQPPHDATARSRLAAIVEGLRAHPLQLR